MAVEIFIVQAPLNPHLLTKVILRKNLPSRPCVLQPKGSLTRELFHSTLLSLTLDICGNVYRCVKRYSSLRRNIGIDNVRFYSTGPINVSQIT